jgi:para-aminobenzoate synthetase component 1
MKDAPSLDATGAPGLPLVEELGPVDIELAFRLFAKLPKCIFLDSALRDSKIGRYSFLAADPFDFLELPADGRDAVGEIERRIRSFTTPPLEDLPPFQGGAAGLLSYELAHSFERLPRTEFDEFRFPAVAVGLYDVVLAFDHLRHRTWLISQGFPEIEPLSRHARARERLRQFRNLLEGDPVELHVANAFEGSALLSLEELAPSSPVENFPNLRSNFSASEYRNAVGRAIDYVYSGDVFQVNLSQRLLYPAGDDAVSLYLRLRTRNPAPFAGYFDLGATQIASASPERFVSVCDGVVEARPIKGTRRRTSGAEADLFAGDDLLQSEKDRAENLMIVDLLRNDLSKVCQPESVRVSQLCGLEIYEYVQHLVSVVEGKLQAGKTGWDLVRAAFPGGSITGAPKVRAMEIIAELEKTARGPYCGSLGYYGFDGSMDLSILIRTITASRGWWQLPVGGGILAQSSPDREYEETWHKAAGLLRALR